MLLPRWFGFDADFSLRDDAPIVRRLQAAFGAHRLEDLPIALRITATDAATGATVVLRKALRGDLDNILAKALRLQPTERYASVAALASFAQVLQRLRDESIDEPSVLGVCLKSRADLHAASGQPQAMLDDAEAAIAALGRAGSTDAKQLSSARPWRRAAHAAATLVRL